MGITLAVSLLYILQILSVWPSFVFCFFLLEKKKNIVSIHFSTFSYALIKWEVLML